MAVLLPLHTIKTFTAPVNIGTGLIDANTVRTNDNLAGAAFNAHDADTSIHVQSGTQAQTGYGNRGQRVGVYGYQYCLHLHE